MPESPVAGLEPLLEIPQLLEWMGVSVSYINMYARREVDPFPLIGTERARRALPSEVIAWMQRNKGATAQNNPS